MNQEWLLQLCTRLVKAIRNDRQFVAIGASVGLLLAIAALHVVSPDYKVTLVVTPVSSNNLGALSGLGELASLAGIESPLTKQSDSFDYYLQGLYSRVAADKVAQNAPLMHKLFKREWSEKTRQWRPETGLISNVSRGVKYVLGIPVEPWAPPAGAQLQKIIIRLVSVDSDKKTRLTKISMIYPDRKVAADTLMALHLAVDGYLRARTLERTTNYINYLNHQINLVTVSEYRQALGQALLEQEKLRMMANSGQPFVAEPFGVPVASTSPVSPSVPVFLIGGMLLGAFAGLGFVRLYRRGWFGRPHSALNKPPKTAVGKVSGKLRTNEG